MEGLSLWKNNVDKRFEGVEDCMICFSVIHGSNYSLPKKGCRTCKKKFHSACLVSIISHLITHTHCRLHKIYIKHTVNCLSCAFRLLCISILCFCFFFSISGLLQATSPHAPCVGRPFSKLHHGQLIELWTRTQRGKTARKELNLSNKFVHKTLYTILSEIEVIMGSEARFSDHAGILLTEKNDEQETSKWHRFTQHLLRLEGWHCIQAVSIFRIHRFGLDQTALLCLVHFV